MMPRFYPRESWEVAEKLRKGLFFKGFEKGLIPHGCSTLFSCIRASDLGDGLLFAIYFRC
jgi:hypothetical protein